MEDKRAHERIDRVEREIEEHLANHAHFENRLISETTRVANSVEELVVLFRGAKGLRAFILWVWPFAVAIAAVFAGAMMYLKGK